MPPSKVTVKVATTVETVKSNGAEIRVVRGSDDITEFLSIPEAENGVVNLAVAEVKPEIVKEAMDAENGAVIDVSGDEPSIKTAATKPGLVYTLWEGESLESMKASTEIGASKIGDGEPFEPTIKINRSNSNSGFYAIEVRK